MAKPPAPNWWVLKAATLMLVLAAYFYLPGVHDFISTGTNYLRTRDFEGLRQFILSYGVWAPLTSIALMTAQSAIPLVPGLAITISNAWIFGWKYGAVYSWAGALCGALLDFGIARWYGRPFVKGLISPRYLFLTDRFFCRHGVLAVFITRLTPVIPFKVVSYSAGLTSTPLWHFAAATGVGQLPAIILYSLLGQHLTHSFKAAAGITTLLIAAGVAAYCFRERIERYFTCHKD